ncbi:CHAT domain-containing protein [Arthrobacter sp. S1_S22]|nr:CHAT domain-containing protein [Arthrobacter sp. S1_S22]
MTSPKIITVYLSGSVDSSPVMPEDSFLIRLDSATFGHIEELLWRLHYQEEMLYRNESVNVRIAYATDALETWRLLGLLLGSLFPKVEQSVSLWNLVIPPDSPGSTRLHRIPWEAAILSDTSTPLGCIEGAMVVRSSVPLGQAVETVSGPPRIASFIALPQGRGWGPELDVDAEQSAISSAYTGFPDAYPNIFPASVSQIQFVTGLEAPDIVHLSAHGSPGHVYLEGTETGQAVGIDGPALSGLLGKYGSLPSVVILSSCESGVAGEAGPDSFANFSLASDLLDAGVHCTIAMNRSVTDVFASMFEEHLYKVLLSWDGCHIASAVQEARTECFTRYVDALKDGHLMGLPGEWFIPICAAKSHVMIQGRPVVTSPETESLDRSAVHVSRPAIESHIRNWLATPSATAMTLYGPFGHGKRHAVDKVLHDTSGAVMVATVQGHGLDGLAKAIRSALPDPVTTDSVEDLLAHFDNYAGSDRVPLIYWPSFDVNLEPSGQAFPLSVQMQVSDPALDGVLQSIASSGSGVKLLMTSRYWPYSRSGEPLTRGHSVGPMSREQAIRLIRLSGASPDHDWESWLELVGLSPLAVKKLAQEATETGSSLDPSLVVNWLWENSLGKKEHEWLGPVGENCLQPLLGINLPISYVDTLYCLQLSSTEFDISPATVRELEALSGLRRGYKGTDMVIDWRSLSPGDWPRVEELKDRFPWLMINPGEYAMVLYTLLHLGFLSVNNQSSGFSENWELVVPAYVRTFLVGQLSERDRQKAYQLALEFWTSHWKFYAEVPPVDMLDRFAAGLES